MHATHQRSTVVGVFHDRNQAERAVEELRRKGFRDDQIGVITRNADGHVEGKDTGSKMEEGAVGGAIAGVGIGTLAGLGVVAGLIPAIGPAIAGGILASILSSAGLGAAAGGLIGGLIGLGIPEDEAGYYEGEFKQGRTIVTVKADGRYDDAWTVLRSHGGYNMQDRSSVAPAARAAECDVTAKTAHTAHAGQTIQATEERLKPRKEVETGEVRIRKEVHVEHETVNVPVQREEVVIERRPASGKVPAGVAQNLAANEAVRIPVREERVVGVEKEVVATEEVHVGKRVVHDTKQVSGTVRKEDVKVETEGHVHVKGDACDTDAKRRNKK